MMVHSLGTDEHEIVEMTIEGDERIEEYRPRGDILRSNVVHRHSFQASSAAAKASMS
ncbi:MAG TPA: hypothetical protein VFI97_05115 [Arthrobacter sp.]|nr:hypothetical protein [Arthrobacter sp.]